MTSTFIDATRKLAQFPSPGRHSRAAEASPPTPVRPLSDRLRGKRLYVAGQLSCASSRVSFSRYEEFILRHGAERAKGVGDADIILFDTCAFNAEREQQSLGLIREHEQAAKPEAKLIVTGCLAGISPDKIQDKYRCDFFAPRNESQLAYLLCLDDEKDQFLKLSDPRGRFMGMSSFVGGNWGLRTAARIAGILHRIDHRVPLLAVPFLKHALAASQAANPHAYALSISRGCLGNCSFCVIPMAKGKTTSLPMGMIVDRVREMVDSGTDRIILTSEDIGAYGKDINTAFPVLLEKIVQIEGRFSLFLHFYDPRWLRTQGEQLLPLLQSGKVKYLQVPLQSGNNRILNLMRRCYLIDQVLPVIEKIRRNASTVSLGTQIIAGFPSETEAEHEDTMRLLRNRLFDYVDVFPFSDRPGAAARNLPGHLTEAVVKERARDLQRAWRRSRYMIP
jgi:threonylcarbamoyladenosine tRNA methylthiotransferase CDKAL1